MKKFFVLVVVFLLFLFSNISLANGMNMKEGLWEITMQMDMPGMQMPPQKFTQCITKDKAIPEDPDTEDKSCKMEYKKITGDTIIWKVVCKDKEGKFTSEGKITYKGNTLVGEIKSKSDGMEMTQKMTGKWVGQCQR
jgi:hypothetical protein